MKRIIFLFLSLLLCTSLCKLQAQSCGQVDCQGQCGRFTDNNKDGYCDFGHLSDHVKDSLANKNKKEESPQPKETIKTENPQSDTIITTQKNETSIDTTKQSSVNETPSQSANNQNLNKETSIFNLSFPLLFSCFIAYVLLYSITFVLSQHNAVKKNTHRKVWNIVLFITLLILSIIGLFSLFIDGTDTLANYNDLIIYYINFGIGILLLTLIHLIAHRSHLKSILCKKAN